MTKEEFINKAKKFGYTDEEINDFIELHEEEPIIKFEDIMLIERIVD